MAGNFVEESVGAESVRLKLARPSRRNGIGPTLTLQLTKLLQKWQRIYFDGAARGVTCIVIEAETASGQHGPIWCGGGDLKELATLSDDEAHAFARATTDLCLMIETYPLPVIGIIDGAAIGGGAEFFLACDIRLATSQACLDFKQQLIGLPTGFGGTRRLCNLIGKAHAQWLLLTAQRLSAPEARELGLFHDVYTDLASAQKSAMELAARMKSFQTQSLGAQKQMLSFCSLPLAKSRVDNELSLFMECWGNEQHRALLRKFNTPPDG